MKWKVEATPTEPLWGPGWGVSVFRHERISPMDHPRGRPVFPRSCPENGGGARWIGGGCGHRISLGGLRHHLLPGRLLPPEPGCSSHPGFGGDGLDRHLPCRRFHCLLLRRRGPCAHPGDDGSPEGQGPLHHSRTPPVWVSRGCGLLQRPLHRRSSGGHGRIHGGNAHATLPDALVRSSSAGLCGLCLGVAHNFRGRPGP